MVNCVKRILCVIMVMLLVLTSVPVGGFSRAKAAMSAEEAVNIFYNNMSVWKFDNSDFAYGIAGYFFIDLDFDGELELVASCMAGTGIFSVTNFYKINGTSLKRFATDFDEYDGLDLVCRDQPKLYKNKSTGKLYYWADNYSKNGWYENYLQEGFFYYDGSKIKDVPLFAESNVCTDLQKLEYDTTYWILDGTDRKVSKSEYNKYKTNYLNGYTNLNLVTEVVNGHKFKDANAATKKQMLLSSYKAFKYDGMGSTSSATTPDTNTLGVTSNISVTKTDTTATLKWDKVEGAEGYRIYQKIVDGWKRLGEIADTACVLKNLRAGTKYTFAIRAYKTENGQQVMATKYATVDVTTTGTATLGTTSNITATKTTESSTLTWNKVSGATGYRIYQKDGDGWIVLADTTNLTYTVKTLKAGTKYTFAVRAYMINSGKRTFAPKYKTIDVTTKLTSLGVTSKITATQTTSSVTLKWNKVAGATGYRIYTMRKGEWKKLADTTKLTYTEKKLNSGSTFKYRIKAYTTSNGKILLASDYKEIETSTKPATSTLKVTSTAKGKVVLNWSNPSGENGFEIYYSTKKDSGFKKIATTKANVKKATVSKLKSKKTYYFKVRSFKTTKSGNAYSAYSAVKGIKVK